MISQVSSYSSYNSTVPSAFSDFNLLRSTNQSITNYDNAEEKKKRSAKLGITVATSSVILGFGMLALMKGMPKGLTKKVENLRKILEERVTKFSDETKKSRMAKYYPYFLKKVEKASEYLNSVNNATTFKDMLFAKLTSKTKVTRKIAEHITSVFERFSRQTVVSGYQSTRRKFNRLYEVLGAADNKIMAQSPDKVVTINGKTLTAKEWLKTISDKKLNLSQTFNAYFGEEAVKMRYLQTKKSMDGLDKKVWDLSFGDVRNNYKNKEIYDTFLPEAILSKEKAIQQKNVDWYKNIIVGSKDKSGGLDEIMNIYKELMPPQEFEKLKFVSDGAVEKLNKAVVLETDKFFDKLRDLKLGSAPTDFLSMLVGLGTVGIGLTKAEDSDERISVSLKYGIPALSAIATSLYLGATLVAGGKALVLSTVSGMLMNKLGTKIDEMREKHILAEKSTTKTV